MREKRPRKGRNPRTGAKKEARRVVTLRPSQTPKEFCGHTAEVARAGESGPARLSLPGSPPVRRGSNGVPRAIAQRRPKIENALSGQLPSGEARAAVGANAGENLMWAMGAHRTRAISAALMLAIGVAACGADEDTSAPGQLPSAEPAAPSERAEEPAEAPKEAAEGTPEADPPAEPANESPDPSGPPAAEPEEEEAPEADRE